MPNHGIEKEIEGIKKIIEGLIEKKVFLEESLLSAYDANQQFSLKKQIAELEKQIKEKREEINRLKGDDLPREETTEKHLTPDDWVDETQPEVIRNVTGATYDNGYALLIGIEYKHWASTLPTLTGAPKDIDALSAHFSDPEKAAYKSENILILKESEATKENILTALDTLADKARKDPEASIIVYFSGHGIPGGLVSYDFEFQKYWDKDEAYKDSMVESKTFSQKIAAIQSKKLLVILDCCHAENIAVQKGIEKQVLFLDDIVKDLTTGMTERNLDRNTLRQGKGHIILTSCQNNETSIDLGTNGLFTEVLLESLRGVKNLKKDGWVRLIDLIHYVPTTVKERALKDHKHKQEPMFKKIENLGAEEFVICAYNLAVAKGLIPLPKPVEPIINKNMMTKLEILNLIDFDLDRAFDELNPVFLDKNPGYHQLYEEYVYRDANFNLKTYKGKLKGFVNLNMR